MNAQAVRPSTSKVPPELQVRLVLMEEGSSAAALASEEDVGTTAMVAIGSDTAAGMSERIEHRILELSRSGRTVKEVLYLLSSSSAEEIRLLRRDALRTVVRALKGSDAEIVLVVPHERATTRHSDLFELTETLMADGGPRLRIRLQFSEDADERPSGFYPSPATARRAQLQSVQRAAPGTPIAG
jgi:hypothetical protein